MSAEIFRKPEGSSKIVSVASIGAADIMFATGTHESDAYTKGARGAQYGAELVLAALTELGIPLPLEEGREELIDTIRVLADISADYRRKSFYEKAQQENLTESDFAAFIEHIDPEESIDG